MKHAGTIAIALIAALAVLVVINAVRIRRLRDQLATINARPDTSHVLPPPLATTPIAPPTDSPINELRKRHYQAAMVVLPIPYLDK